MKYIIALVLLLPLYACQPCFADTPSQNVKVGSPANGLSVAAPNTLNLGLSSASTTGALSPTNWNTFNSKQSALSFTAPLVNTAGTVTCNVASGSLAGCLSSTDWNTFNGKQAALSFGNLTSTNTTNLTVSGGSGAVIGGGAAFTLLGASIVEATSSVLNFTGATNAVLGTGVSIQVKQAATSQSGYLSSTDWNTFNGKQAALTIGNLTAAGTDGIAVTAGTGSVIGSGTSLAQHVADSTHNGYLTSTDWSTFNGKQSALAFADSLVNTAGTVTLVNDSVSPGNNKYYGTNGSGTLGWQASSAGGGATAFYAQIVYQGISNCNWTTASTTVMGDPAANTNCNTPTVTTGAALTGAGGSVAAPGTKVPQIVFTNLPAGEYEVIAAFRQTIDSGNTACFYQLFDGTNASGVNGGAPSTASFTNGLTLIGRFNYGSTQGSLTFKIQSAGGVSGCYMVNDKVLGQLSITVYRVS